MTAVNTRTALWPERWPAIALQECIDRVEASEPEHQAEAKWNLPCEVCPEQTRCLNAKRKELGPLLYDREILTSPRSQESSLFPLELFEPMLMRDQQMVPYWNKPLGDEQRHAVCSAWDIAWSEKVGGDWLVRFTAYVDRQTGKRHVLDINRWQKLTFQEQCQLIEQEWAKFKDDLVVIEDDFAQRVWHQQLSSTTAVPVMRHSAGTKSDLAQGVPGLLLELENQQWEFPYQPGSHHHENMRVFLSECEAFGWNDGKLEGVGEHDDTVMAWWHCQWGLGRLVQPPATEYRRGVQRGRTI